MLCAPNALITYFGKLDNDWDQRLHLTAILPDRDRFSRANNLNLLGLNASSIICTIVSNYDLECKYRQAEPEAHVRHCHLHFQSNI